MTCPECDGDGGWEDVEDWPSPVDGEHCQRVTHHACERCDGEGEVENEEEGEGEDE